MTTHHLKTWPEYFEAIIDGSKNFEVRKNDRDYKVGDVLELHEFKPNGGFTNRSCERIVSYILKGGQFGIEAGYVVMGLETVF